MLATCGSLSSHFLDMRPFAAVVNLRNDKKKKNIQTNFIKWSEEKKKKKTWRQLCKANNTPDRHASSPRSQRKSLCLTMLINLYLNRFRNKKKRVPVDLPCCSCAALHRRWWRLILRVISCLESFGKCGADGWPLIHIITIVHHSFTSFS